MSNNTFFYKKLTYDNLDNYHVRNSIKKAIDKSLPLFKGKMLDAGCGQMPYKDYILSNSKTESYTGLDIETALEYSSTIKPDVTWNGKQMPFEDGSFNTVFITEVLEHCLDFHLFIDECLRVLKPNGILFFTVPFLWPLHEAPHDNFRYTPFALQEIFASKNTVAEIKALGGWNASLATMLGLWGKRYVSKKKAKFLVPFLKPVIAYLLKRDKIPVDFTDNTMVTGLYGIIKKN